MRNISKLITLLACFFALGSCSEKVSTIWVDDLAIVSFSEGIRPVKAKANYLADTIRIGGVRYQRGIGSITTAVFPFFLNGNARRFMAEVGADDKANKDIPIRFYVVGDKKVLFESGEMRVGDPAKKIDLNLKGIQRLGLLVTDDIGGLKNKMTYCNWANARFEMIPDSLPKLIPNSDEKQILTPVPPETPKINSAKIFGATPGNPFLYSISTTGKRPMQFSAENLPAGLILDSRTGIITGKVNKCGIYFTTLKAKNELGESTRQLKICIGDTISLTPPIGWNGWNSWAEKIDREKVISTAKAMVNKGLSDHGWSYINIDDAWQGRRGGKLNALQPNEKFPDIKGMVDYIHSLGLKAGIYSTPYVWSYAGYVGASSDFEKGGEKHEPIKTNRRSSGPIGKYRFETNDALQMAEWGFDYLKYDWRIDVTSTERMSAALKKSGRDVVFSISNNAPIEKAADLARLTNAWRTGPDIRDSWTSLYSLAFTIDKWAEFAGPGHWNDPDMMILGNVSMGPTELHPSRLTPDEQYSHVSIFSLLAAPLLIGCPIEQLDDFTLNLLTNDEVIEVNQDPLGKPARLVADENGVHIWAKPMEDGSLAVGLFNTDDFGKTPQSYFRWGDEQTKQFVFDFAKVGLKGKWKLRDLWRQKDLGEFTGEFTTEIRHHAVVMLRLFP
ncbi:MAG: NPCBM/NEW2 domain-containing protein [Bacteroidia bacterium]|nr:NPCBM/NEW2 domain-containing protein [Bacteroidia bacterium]